MSRAFVLVLLSIACSAGGRAAPIWRIAPAFIPQPDAARRSELAQRRERVMQRIGPAGMLILFAAEPNIYANDIEFPYREDNDFYYLTGVQQTGAALVLIPGATGDRELLLLPDVTRAREIFYGTVISGEEAKARSGIAQIAKMENLPALLRMLAPRLRADLAELGHLAQPDPATAEKWKNQDASLIEAVHESRADLYFVLPSQPGVFENRRSVALAKALVSASSGFAVHDAAPLFRSLRETKSPSEVALIQQAIDISAEAFERVMATIAPSLYEYDLQAQFDFTFTRRHAHWGYPPIVGSGRNATTLHYDANQDRLLPGSLVVIDAGSEYGQYSADVTRTLPVSGKFSGAQADIYRVVYAAQHAAMAVARPGTVIGSLETFDPNTYQGRAAQAAKEGLLRLGLITSMDGDQYRRWYLHGMTHQLGMNVHDPGSLDMKLAEGMVLTDEPGIYIRADALDVLEKTPENEKFIAAVEPAFEKYKGIGVRIEDDLLITAGDAKVLSAGIPSKLEAVEKELARLKTARLKTPLP